MSQQGIFSIAPDAQPGHSNGASAPSPFTAVSETGSRPSPFQSVQEDGDRSGAAIPQPRPEGQPPATKVAQDAAGQVEESAPVSLQQAVFEPAPQNGSAAPQTTGGPFQMNGFPEQSQGQFTEAAPVAANASDSPFVAVQNNGHHDDYEAAKAGLEPQQDFAAVGGNFAAPQQQAQPQEQPKLTPIATSAMATAPAPAQPAAAPAAQPSPAFQQLELRAIFGVDHLLDQKEIIQRARTLPGVRNVAVVGQNEASALSNFRTAMQGMGFGDSHDLKLHAGGGDVDFLTEGETTIAVLHEGVYAPGVQETLIIVARELGKLS